MKKKEGGREGSEQKKGRKEGREREGWEGKLQTKICCDIGENILNKILANWVKSTKMM